MESTKNFEDLSLPEKIVHHQSLQQTLNVSMEFKRILDNLFEDPTVKESGALNKYQPHYSEFAKHFKSAREKLTDRLASQIENLDTLDLNRCFNVNCKQPNCNKGQCMKIETTKKDKTEFSFKTIKQAQCLGVLPKKHSSFDNKTNQEQVANPDGKKRKVTTSDTTQKRINKLTTIQTDENEALGIDALKISSNQKQMALSNIIIDSSTAKTSTDDILMASDGIEASVISSDQEQKSNSNVKMCVSTTKTSIDGTGLTFSEENDPEDTATSVNTNTQDEFGTSSQMPGNTTADVSSKVSASAKLITDENADTVSEHQETASNAIDNADVPKFCCKVKDCTQFFNSSSEAKACFDNHDKAYLCKLCGEYYLNKTNFYAHHYATHVSSSGQ